MKWCLILLFFSLQLSGLSQNIRAKNRYGDKLFFVDNYTLHEKDRYVEKLLFWDGRTIHEENRYGEKIYFIEGNTVRKKDRYGKKNLLLRWIHHKVER